MKNASKLFIARGFRMYMFFETVSKFSLTARYNTEEQCF